MSCSTIQKGTEVCFGNPITLTGYLVQDATISKSAQEKKIVNESGNTVTVINYDAEKTISINAVVLSATTPDYDIGDTISLGGENYRITKFDLKYQAGSECMVGIDASQNCSITLA